MISSALRVATKLHLVPELVRDSLAQLRGKHALRNACQLVPAVLRELAPLPGVASPVTWSIQHATWTSTNIAVIAVGPRHAPPVVMLKMPHTAEGAASLRQQQVVQAALHQDARLGSWSALLPQPHGSGEVSGQFYIIEQALPGQVGSPLIRDAAACKQLQLDSATIIGELHRRTANTVVLDSALIQQQIDEPLRRIRTVSRLLPSATRHATALDRLQAELYTALAGRTLTLGWIHGDYWPGNLLLECGSTRLLGIVDWDRAAPQALAAHDLLHLLLFPRALQHDQEPGEVVAALLQGARWTKLERIILDHAELPLFDTVAGERAMLLLYWLRSRAATLGLLPNLVHNRRWMARNIEIVLQCI